MKISKLFHWLYAILMFLPFGLLVFNALHGLFSPSSTGLVSFDTWLSQLSFLDEWVGNSGLSETVYTTYEYLINNIFGITTGGIELLQLFLTYWTCVSIIWLVFDVFMYVPLLVHRWIDKAKLE